MGWGRWLLLGDLGQQMDLADRAEEIRHLKSTLARRQRRSGDQAASLRKLEQENDELKLCLAAVIRLLVRKGIASAEEIRQLAEAIDAEDGAADGKREGGLLDPS
jgi:hypothetical protein